MPYAASVRARPNAKYRRGPYRKRLPYRMPYPSKLRTIRSVPGARPTMSVGLPRPQEVKYCDINSTDGTLDPSKWTQPSTGGGNWHLLSTNSVGAITQGGGNSQRLGREIRVVGIVYRMNVFTATSAGPSTIDFVWDSQCNNLPPGNVDIIYNNVSRTALSNPLHEERFTFLKRLETRDPQNQNVTLSGMIKCNKQITYSGNTGFTNSVVTNNLVVTCSAQTIPTITGSYRILYVDA